MPDARLSAGLFCGACSGVELKRWWQASQWYVLVAAGIAALGLGCLGHMWHFRAAGLAPSFFDVLHPSLQLFVLNAGAVLHPNWALQVARFLAPLTLGYAAVQAFVVVTLQRVQKARISRAREHAVVCGLGRKGVQLVRDFRAQGKTVVVIDKDEHNDHLRLCRNLGAIVLVGDATHDDLLRQARVPAAGHVIATTGDDGINVEIAVHAYRLFLERPRTYAHRLRCLVHVVDATLCAVFKHAPMFRSDTDLFEVKVFNIFENCARLLFEEHPLDRLPVGAASPATVRLAVIGFGKMGQAVAVQAARIGHFANGRKLRVTVVDKKAEEVKSGLLALYPQFWQVCDVEFIQALAGGAEVNERLARLADEPDSLLTVAVCLDDGSMGLTRALGMAEKLQNHDVSILVRMEEDTGLASLLKCEQACDSLAKRVRAFGEINRASALDRILSDRQDRIARRVHENYLAVACADPNKRKDDEALRDWEQLPDSYRDANRHVADHVAVKLRAVGLTAGKAPTRDFTANEIEVLSRMEHARWVGERLLAGWRYAPPPKDEQRKTNPNIVPWDQLDEVNKEKDRKAVRELHQWLTPSAPNK
ncbi:MAG: NAD-binding protein [bacterium]